MLNWSPNVSSSLHKPSLVFRRGCRSPSGEGAEGASGGGEALLASPLAGKMVLCALRPAVCSPLLHPGSNFLHAFLRALARPSLREGAVFVLVVHLLLLFPRVLLQSRGHPRTRQTAGTPWLVPRMVPEPGLHLTGADGRARDHRSYGQEMGPVTDLGRTDGSAPMRSHESSRYPPCPTSLESAFELPLIIFNNRLDKYLPKNRSDRPVLV